MLCLCITCGWSITQTQTRGSSTTWSFIDCNELETERKTENIKYRITEPKVLRPEDVSQEDTFQAEAQDFLPHTCESYQEKDEQKVSKTVHAWVFMKDRGLILTHYITWTCLIKAACANFLNPKLPGRLELCQVLAFAGKGLSSTQTWLYQQTCCVKIYNMGAYYHFWKEWWVRILLFLSVRNIWSWLIIKNHTDEWILTFFGFF